MSNALVVTSGMLCDGAKPSCAGKIQSALEAAYSGYDQALEGDSYKPGDGMVGENIDETIKTIGKIAYEGMQETDVVLLNEMIKGR